MTHRLRLAAPLLALAAATAGCHPAPAADTADGWAGAALPAPVARPDFTLTDTEGRPYDFLEETRGKVALLFFGYTHCPDVCPVHMANLAAVLDDLPPRVAREWVEVVFVSTDPERDTPERIRAWLDGFHPGFVGLRGTPTEVNAVEDALGLPPSLVESGEGDDYFVGHAAQVLAFGADGPALRAYPWGTRQRDWLRDLPRLVRETVPGAADAWPRGPAETAAAAEGG